MQHVFIINPAAGKRMDINRVQADLETLMKQRSDDWCIETTQCAGDAERIARNWCEKTNAPTRIYAFGGDGTLNEVVNGAAGYVHVEVGCCPLGSGNDFIKTYGTAEQFRDISALLDAPSYVTDLIDCNGRLSVNICSAGLDSRVGLGMANYKNLPFVTGNGAYIISLLVNVIRGIHRPYEIELDGEKLSGRYTLIAACNGRWYGGTFNPTPKALPNDGVIDFVIIKGVSRLTVANLVGKYSAGRGEEYPDLIRFHRGRSIKIKCSKMEMVQVDGERMDADSLSICLSAKKIRFIVPQSTLWKTENK